LAELVAALFDATRDHQIALELVVVDDNSPDGTGALADELARKYRVRVIHRAGKLGLGTAVVEGFRVASADIVGVMDADFSHPPAMVPHLFSAIRQMERFKQLPIIALTAKAMKADRDRCFEVGASDYISKPLDIDQLLSLLRVWLYQQDDVSG